VTSVDVPDELFARLREYFDYERAVVKLTATHAWENIRRHEQTPIAVYDINPYSNFGPDSFIFFKIAFNIVSILPLRESSYRGDGRSPSIPRR
jgi:hypothetical protein